VKSSRKLKEQTKEFRYMGPPVKPARPSSYNSPHGGETE